MKKSLTRNLLAGWGKGIFIAVCWGGNALAGPSLQDRIDAAEPGATLRIEAGKHAGPLLLSRPVTLIGEPGAEIDGNGVGSVIVVTGQGVTVRGFHITGSGVNLSKDDAGVQVKGDDATIADNRIDDVLHGIYLKKVRGARIEGNTIRGKTSLTPPVQPTTATIVADDAENCGVELNVNVRGNGIHLWNSENNLIENNDIAETRDGMYFSFTRHTKVRGNSIRRVRYGLHYMYSDDNTFEKNTFEENAAGAAMMFSKNLIIRGNRFEANRGSRAYGMLLNSVDMTRLENNDLEGNTVGIYLENSNSNVFTGNNIARNYIGIRLTGSSGENAFSRNRFAGNMHPVELAGQSETNRWMIGGVGNFWQDAGAIDLTGDGVGDFAHRESDVLGGLRRPFPLIGLLSGSPGVDVLRFGRSHAPLPDTRAITDPAPLTPSYKQP